jgi:hypothetical protein
VHIAFDNRINGISLKRDIADLNLAIMEDIFNTKEGDKRAKLGGWKPKSIRLIIQLVKLEYGLLTMISTKKLTMD